MSQRIRDSFNVYLRINGLADVSPSSVRTLRRAFFAGAALAFIAEQEVVAMDEDEGLARLKALRAECVEFGMRVIEGKD